MTDTEPKLMTICVKCVHHRAATGSGIWYDQYCDHPELARVQGVDCVTGVKCFWDRNDLGGAYATDEHRPYCRSINDKGECDFYETMLEKVGQ